MPSHSSEPGTARLPPYAERIEKDDECRWVRCTVCGNEAPNLRHLEHDCIYSNDLVADGGSETYTSGTDRKFTDAIYSTAPWGVAKTTTKVVYAA